MMQPLAADTPTHIEAATLAVLREMTIAQKAAMLAQMCAMSDQLALIGIRMQHPQAPLAVVTHELALRRLLPERQAVARRLFEELPAMTFPVNPIAIAGRIGAVLERLGVRYYIGGSFASSIFGEYRTTRDLDVVLEPPHAGCTQLAAAFQADFMVLPEDVRDALQRRSAEPADFVDFTMYDRPTGYQVDMFLARNAPYECAQFQRTFAADLGEGVVYVPSAEDTILNTLRWYALTPSDTQWRDVQAIIRVQGNHLSTPYLQTWARELGLEQLLNQALNGNPPDVSPAGPDQLRLF